MDKFIRNIDHESVVRLAELVSVQSGQVVSKTLAQNKAVSITLFAFDKGEEIGTHDSTGDAMVTVLEGTGRFTVGGVPHIVKAGETFITPTVTTSVFTLVIPTNIVPIKLAKPLKAVK